MMKKTISSLFLLQIYLFGLMVTTSCSKNEPEVVNDTTVPAAEFVFYQYSQIPGSDPNNGLIAKQVNNSTGDEIFFYGSFDETGVAQSPKSFVVKKYSTDTLMNVFVDENMRPTMVYFSHSNGEKYSTLWTYEWSSDDSFLFRKFTYDWATQTDNLDYETFVTHSDGQYSFSDNFVRTSSVGLDVPALFEENLSYRAGSSLWTSTIGGAVATGLGVVAAVGVGIYGAVTISTATGVVAAVILASAVLAATANASEGPINNNNVNNPPNPNDSPNPSPVSNVNNPTNLTTTTGSSGTTGTDGTTGTTNTSGTTGSDGTTGTTNTSGTTGSDGTTGTTSTSGTTGSDGTTGTTNTSGTTGSDGTTGTTSTSGTTGSDGTTGTTSTSGTTGSDGTTGTTNTSGTTGSDGTTGTTNTTGFIDTLGMPINKPRLSHQLRRELYDNRQSKK